MVAINIDADIKQVERMLGSLSRKIIPQAASRALNKGIKKGESIAVKAISKATGIRPQKKVRKYLRISKASIRDLESSVQAFPAGLNLIEFVTPGKRTSKAFKKKRGVTANAWGRKKEYKGRFIGRGKTSGKALVFERTTNKAYPIKATYGPSIPKTFMRDVIIKSIMNETKKVFMAEFHRQVNLKLNKMI